MAQLTEYIEWIQVKKEQIVSIFDGSEVRKMSVWIYKETEYYIEMDLHKSIMCSIHLIEKTL